MYSDQAEMSLEMMRTLANLTQMMVKHTEETPMVEGWYLTLVKPYYPRHIGTSEQQQINNN